MYLIPCEIRRRCNLCDTTARAIRVRPRFSNCGTCTPRGTRTTADNLLRLFIDRLRNTEFYSLQVDECTDIAVQANLLVYVGYTYGGSICEGFSFQALLQALEAFVRLLKDSKLADLL